MSGARPHRRASPHHDADGALTPAGLRAVIGRLDPDTPRHKELERVLGPGAGMKTVWYRSQQEHLAGWLAQYDGPGAYGRKIQSGRTARFAYNHFQCAPALFWLAEVLGVDDATLTRAFDATAAAGRRTASQCGALRREVPWATIEARIAALGLP